MSGKINIGANLDLMNRGGSISAPQTANAMLAAHQAARDQGFVIGAKVQLRNTEVTGEVVGFNTIRHQGMRNTGDRSPLLIRRSDGIEKEHSTGELVLLNSDNVSGEDNVNNL